MNPQPSQRRPENLAFAFQELLTVGERLRSNRQQVADAPTFRAQIWGGVKLADDDAKKRGYSPEDIELATFAVVAFLDESILNLRSPVFSDWPRQPLQEERYGHHIAGEIFSKNLQKLSSRSDSQELADLLSEVLRLVPVARIRRPLQPGRTWRSGGDRDADRRAHPKNSASRTGVGSRVGVCRVTRREE